MPSRWCSLGWLDITHQYTPRRTVALVVVLFTCDVILLWLKKCTFLFCKKPCFAGPVRKRLRCTRSKANLLALALCPVQLCWSPKRAWKYPIGRDVSLGWIYVCFYISITYYCIYIYIFVVNMFFVFISMYILMLQPRQPSEGRWSDLATREWRLSEPKVLLRGIWGCSERVWSQKWCRKSIIGWQLKLPSFTNILISTFSPAGLKNWKCAKYWCLSEWCQCHWLSKLRS